MPELSDFLKFDLRVGKVVAVDDFPEARKPSYKLLIDFGEKLGVKKSIAQLTHHYDKNALTGKLVVCVTNFPPRQIGKAVSEVLTLGLPDGQGHCVLLVPDAPVPLGGKVY